MNDDAAKTDERQKVRDGHESIHAVGKVPHQRQIDNAAHKDAHDVDHAIEKHPALALEILDTTLAIIAPAKGCAEGEGGETEGEQRRSDIRNLAEGYLGKGGTVMIVDVGIGNNAGGDDQTCERTDDNRVPERGCGRHQRLTYRIARLGSSGNNGRGAKTRLVGEQAAGNAITRGHDECAACKATTGRLCGERRIEDYLKSREQISMVHKQDVDATQHIKNGHEGHKHAAHFGYRLNATHDDGRTKGGDDKTCDVGRDVILVLYKRGDGVGLNGAAYAERGKGCKDGEEHGKPLPA